MVFLLRTQMTLHKQNTNDGMTIVELHGFINTVYGTSTGLGLRKEERRGIFSNSCSRLKYNQDMNINTMTHYSKVLSNNKALKIISIRYWNY